VLYMSFTMEFFLSSTIDDIFGFRLALRPCLIRLVTDYYVCNNQLQINLTLKDKY